MIDCDVGFRIGETLHPWGTLFDTVAPDRVDRGYACVVELPCRDAYGFSTVYAEPSAARPDRPVTSIAYELADTGLPSRNLFAQLVSRLGPPDEVDRSELPTEGNAGDSVVLYASWRRDTIAIGLSLYGAPRPSDFGNGLGKLYLSWTDVQAAAAPFMAAWTAASQAVADAAIGAEPGLFSVRYPIYEADYAAPAARELALSMPELLRTPPAIAALLHPTTFALWSDVAGTRWHLSTGRSTIVLGRPETSLVLVAEIAPAKGGGYSALEVGPWSVRDAFQSTDISRVAQALENLPGLRIERHSGYDV